jgi:transposase-like protein
MSVSKPEEPKRPERKRRSFTREFKLSVLKRMRETDSIVGLAEELGLERKLLYCWRDKYADGGAENLRRAGRPSAATSAERAQPGEPAVHTAPDAQQRITELERKVGQQQLEVDFFRAALQQVRERRRTSGAPGAKASTP